MKDGKYIDKNGRIVWAYHQPYEVGGECCKCGKYCRNPICLVYDGDEQGLEWLYGSDCVKQLKLLKA